MLIAEAEGRDVMFDVAGLCLLGEGIGAHTSLTSLRLRIQIDDSVSIAAFKIFPSKALDRSEKARMPCE